MIRTALLLAATFFTLLSAEVIHLNGKNFDQIVDGTRNVLVKFEASWCGPCKAMAPILDAASRAYPDIEGDVLIAAVDADEEDEIGTRFQIAAFPTLKLFLRGRSQQETVEFNGERSIAGFNQFIDYHVAQNEASLPADFKTAPKKSVRAILNATKTLKQVLNNANPFLKAERKHKKHPANGGHKQRQQNNGLAIPKLPKQPKQPKQPRAPRADEQQRRGRVVAQPADLIRDVSDSEARAIISSAGNMPVVVIFYSHTCPHCQEFLPIAREYSRTRGGVIFLQVDGQKYYQYRDTFNLQYYPSIIGFKAGSGGSRWELLRGGRSINNLNTFIAGLQ